MLIEQAISRYPEAVRSYYSADAPRLTHDLGKVLGFGGSRMVDLGAGLSPLALAAQLGGVKATIVDRFDYSVDMAHGVPVDTILGEFEKVGVSVVRSDIQNAPLPLPDSAFDVATCLAVLEHFHHSPRSFLAEVRRVLRPGGTFLVSCPNSVNLRKRFSVLLGRSNLPPIEAFWRDGDPTWHGHVREPTAGELAWMISQAGFEVKAIFGRNFIAIQNFKIFGLVVDPLLKFWFGLCSDVYVLANLPIK